MPEIAFLALSLSSHYFGIIFQYFHKHTQRHGGTGGEAYAGDITGQPGIGTHISTTFQGEAEPWWSSHTPQEMRK